MTDPSLPRPVRRPGFALHLMHGATFIIVSLAAGLVMWFLMGRLEVVASRAEVKLPGLTAWCVENSWWPTWAVLPAVLFGVLEIVTSRYKWLWLMLATLALVVPALLALYCTVMVIGPLYQVQPL